MELRNMELSAKMAKMPDFCFDSWLRDDIRVKIVTALGVLGKKQKEKMDKELGGVELTGTQVQVMLYILQCNVRSKIVTAKDLETYFQVKNSTISGILKRLERKELIERIEDENDRRNKQIRIKGNFMDLCGNIDERVKHETEKMFRGFSVEELKELFRLLTKLLHNIN